MDAYLLNEMRSGMTCQRLDLIVQRCATHPNFLAKLRYTKILLMQNTGIGLKGALVQLVFLF